MSDSDTAFYRLRRATRQLPVFTSLRVRLILLVLVAVLPAFGLVIYSAVEQRKQGEKQAKEEALRLVRMAADNQDQRFESGRQLLVTLAQLNELKTLQGEATTAIFTNLLRTYPAYANIGAVNSNGEVFASAVPLTNKVSLADKRYIQEARLKRDIAISDFQRDKITGTPTVSMALPIIDSTNSLVGVVFASLDLEWLNHMADTAKLPEGSTLTVLDRKGKVLIRYPSHEQYIGQSLPTPSKPIVTPDKIVLSLNEGVIQATGLDGVERLYALTRLGGRFESRPVLITVGIPVSEAFAAANITLQRNLAFLGVVALVTMTAAWYASAFLVLRRVNTLVSATKKLSDGDYSVRTGFASGTGELHQLARSFDEMAASLEQRIAAQQKAEVELKGLNEDLEKRVTERTRELERSNQDLEQFAYVASHDLQEPLRMVTNYMQLLRQRYSGKLDANADDFIRFALDGSERMHRLINDLLTYSRVGTQGKPFELTDCEEVLHRTLKNLKVMIEENKAVVTHDQLPTVMGDMVQLTQLFQNLISNGIKFHGEEVPKVHISAKRQDGEWLFSIQDNGIGIAPKDFERIFLIFQRLHTRDKYAGSGIGLAVCKKIVERHGGRIWPESTPGKGTTFFFTLPAHE